MLICIPKRALFRPFLNGFVLIALVVSGFAQPQDNPDRRRAFELYDANNLTAALPLLEKLATANPNDVAVLSRLGFALYAGSSTENDPAARNRLRQRARDTLLRARSLGDNSNLTIMVLDALSSPDSTNVPFSRIQAADAAIREGEAAFVRGDMDQAIAAYKRALEIDPRLYDAALYAGDAEFKKAHKSTDPQFRNDHFNAAGVWFAKGDLYQREPGNGLSLLGRRAGRAGQDDRRRATSLSKRSSPILTTAILMWD
jgi:tetratricopeptide (TPR) repeat protein